MQASLQVERENIGDDFSFGLLPEFNKKSASKKNTIQTLIIGTYARLSFLGEKTCVMMLSK